MQGEGRLREGVRGLQSFWQALTLAEVSGACGDLGVFIPLVVSHHHVNAVRSALSTAGGMQCVSLTLEAPGH